MAGVLCKFAKNTQRRRPPMNSSRNHPWRILCDVPHRSRWSAFDVGAVGVGAVDPALVVDLQVVVGSCLAGLIGRLSPLKILEA
ncbi:MAG: hypothetical protein KKE89_03755 [Actinobacteria bacterium]|nr:hypothetical protein [Actinomycetota bacterium]MBU1865506.1 hypothetical protein [Actinomycetota bacterium]